MAKKQKSYIDGPIYREWQHLVDLRDQCQQSLTKLSERHSGLYEQLLVLLKDTP